MSVVDRFTRGQRLILTLAISSLLSVALFLIRAVVYETALYRFLNWNLILAWVPLFFAWELAKWIRTRPWASWQGVVMTLLWLGFLPNSFYLTSDLIHMRWATADTALYDTVLLLSFAWNGLVLGFLSLYVIHRQLLKRLWARNAHLVVGLVLLLCSFAIYLGRQLRWSTWDVLINPAGILFDVSDRIINPAAYPQTFTTTATFFALLSTMYFVIWQFVQIFKPRNP